MQITEEIVRNVVAQVISEVRGGSQRNHLRPQASVTGRHEVSRSPSERASGRFGQFTCADRAVAAARDAFEQLRLRPMEDRRKAIDHIRRISIAQAVELGTMEMNETKIGRLPHKIDKLETLGKRTPGTEFLTTQAYSGDRGLTVIEHAPFGVIGAITPVTHSLPTITGNAVSMIAAGNSLVVNPHPSGRKVAAEGVKRFNQAIYEDIGIDNLISVIVEPTLESAEAIFGHRDIALICVTGGPAVARAALNSGKRAVVAGPGNPPVVVDETADLDRAARAIVQGASYDNNLLCIAEKEVFVVDSIFDAMLSAMQRAGAVRLNESQIHKLTQAAFSEVGDDRHLAPSKELLGQDASKLAAAAGLSVDASVLLLFGETPAEHPFVLVEQMMPFVPFVRCRDIDQAIELARRAEHGYRHTSLIHSQNVRNMTRMARALDTTLFIKNGPCMAGLGLGGEGNLSFSIAGPTGEGVTTPLTFTRERRCSLVDDLWILGGTT